MSLETDLAEALLRNKERLSQAKKRKAGKPQAAWETQHSQAQIERLAGRISKRLSALLITPAINQKAYRHHTGAKKDLAKYGLTEQQYVEMAEKQKFACAICAKVEQFSSALAIDHCHATGRVRGLLCRRCNTGLGQFRDDPELLLKAIHYLAQ